MGKVKGKHRLDKYYRLAKEHGYRSRAAWKLVQIDAKFSILRSSHAVLDLCAAPGGWMQAAVERIPVGSLVVGIDLVPIAPVRGAVSIEEDITKSECKAKIKRVMNEHGVRTFDLILHDGSPNVGGAWAKEATSQNALVIDSVKLATQFLAPKGHFVTKVFRSQDYSSVLYCLRQLFEKVDVFKPPASRGTSAEIYVLGLRYKAPAKIDPRLLDFKHLFQGAMEPQKVVDVLRGTKQKRHRDGYEDGETMFKKVSSAVDFIWSDNPLEMLGLVTSISFNDPASLPIKDHTLTTEEVKHLCEDLRVLGKQDFKQLLKWRMHMRKALSPMKMEKSAAIDVESENKDEDEIKDDEDEKIITEMEDLSNAMERKKKREKKLLSKRRAKDKARTGMQVDAMEDGYTDHELFSLSSIKDKKDLVAVDSTEFDGENVDLSDSEDENREGVKEHTLSDTDEERQRYDDQVEDLLDQAYERFVAKKGGSTKQRKRAKQSYAEDGQLLEGGDDDSVIHSDHDEPDHDDGDHEANPLMVPFDEREAPTQDEITQRWFSQDIFTEAVEQGDLGKSDSEDEMQIDKQYKTHPISKKAKENTATQSAGVNRLQMQANKADEDFEIVPAPETDSSDSSSSDESEEEVDDDTKAEILACAKKMLRKKQRDQIIDDSYNKYMFDDEGLPLWFIEEEKKHRVPIKPVTKEEVAAMRAQFREIDARPAKKVAEAEARKKRVAMRKLEKVRKKANTISDQADINDRSKRKMIEQLYKKAAPQRPKKEYVVAKKGVQVSTGKGKVLVDPRMKKDLRARKAGKQGKGGSKNGKNGKNQKGNKGPAKGSASKGHANGSASKGHANGSASKGPNKGYKGRKTRD